MEPYRYEFADGELEALARVVSDLFPEQTLFAQRSAEDGSSELTAQWVAMRFGPSARRMTLTIRFAPPALARYRALPPRMRARSFAVLRAFVEAALGTLEEQYADGVATPRELTIDLGEEFA